MGRNITLVVEEELIKKAKEKGINISKLLRESLTNALESKKDFIEKCDDTIMFLEKIKKDIDNGIILLKNEKRRYLETKEEKQRTIVDKYKDIPEIQGLSTEFLEDKNKMLGLVEVLREKYPELRISVSEIKEYFQL